MLQQGTDSSGADRDIIGNVEGDVRIWSQVAVGHLSGEEACSLSLLRASTPDAAEWLGRLFPSRSPSLPTLDHF